MTLSSALRSTRGFTLIELLVVIVIIGILATGAIAIFQGAQAKARDSQRISDLEAVKSALEQYFNDNDKYPVDNTVANFQTKLKGYINKWPKDPVNSAGYQYVYCVGTVSGVTQQSYALATRMEKKESARKNALSILTSLTGADAEATYVTGSDPTLISSGGTTSAAASCTTSGGTTGGVIL